MTFSRENIRIIGSFIRMSSVADQLAKCKVLNGTNMNIQMLIFVILITWINAQNSTCDSVNFDEINALPLGDAMTLKYQIRDSRICIRIRSTGNGLAWMAFGVARSAAMVSSPESNAVVFNAADSAPKVYELGGRSTAQVTEHPNGAESIQVVSSSASNGDLEMTFERSLSAATISDVSISTSDPTSLIYAYGTSSWPISSHESASSRGVGSLTFSTSDVSAGGIEEVDTFITTLTVPLALGIFVVCSLLGLLLTLTPLRNTALGHVLLQQRLGQPPKGKQLFITEVLDLHVGELVLITLYLIGLLVVALHVSSKFDSDISLSMISGHLAAVNLMFVLMSISKWPFWQWVFGISEDRLVKFHRVVARVFVICTIIHLISSHDTCGLLFGEECGTQKVIPVYGFIAFVAFESMSILALDPVRRSFYEVFYYYHRFAAVVGLIFAILHAKTLRLILIAPLIVYALGYLRRLQGFANACTIRLLSTTRDSIAFFQVESNDKTVIWSQKMPSGSFFWVCFPDVSRTQWHPFSAIASPDGTTIGFAIRSAGKGSFTNRVLQKFQHGGSSLKSRVFLDGPYGRLSIVPNDYKQIVLIAGGIGVTPLLSIFNQCVWAAEFRDVERITLIWTVRHADELLCCDEFMFTAISNEPGDVTPFIPLETPTGHSENRKLSSRKCLLFVTQAPSDGTVQSSSCGLLTYSAGRPKLESIFANADLPQQTAVLACGPEPLIDDAQRLAQTKGYDFHKEIFYW